MNSNKNNNTPKEEITFLTGPQNLFNDIIFSVKVFFETLSGVIKLRNIGPCVTIFGSARFNEHHKYYKLGEAVGAAVAKLGVTVLTGGGPGVMEASNKGAKSVGGRSVGANIVLPREQYPNIYLDTWIDLKYFFVRKVLLLKYSYAFVVLPGGVGTLDELFESVTLIQTKKIEQFPIVLIGTEFFKPLMDLMHHLATEGTIAEEDIKMFYLTDDIDDAMQYIKKNALDRFNLQPE